jgi:hypothetical protein
VIFFLISCFSWSQSLVTFVIQKPKLNPLDTILACHNKVFYSGDLASTTPNLRGLGTHYHELDFAWIDFSNSTFYVVKDTGSFITENHSNGHLYWFDTETDIFKHNFPLDSFLLDSTNGSWRGVREDTLGRKDVVKIIVKLKQCGITIVKTKGYYKKDYLYQYTILNKFNIEVKKWRFTLRNPLITWIEVGEAEYVYFEESIPKSVIEQYKETLDYQ